MKIKRKTRKDFFEHIEDIFKVHKDVKLIKDLTLITINKKNEQLPVLIYFGVENLFTSS